MPWRDRPEPYWVFVSEMMLQQTQVTRVLTKFAPFVERFPSFEELAAGAFSDVLSQWSGLGYNRRARFMHRSAKEIVETHDGELPRDTDRLRELPGIGPNTAGSIAAFAYNEPVVFIETNIRRVFLHFFFPEEDRVHDRRIFPLIAATLDRDNPRRWYWALMDYGVALSRVTENPNRRSQHYNRQKPFAGSDRQLRGRILKVLTERGSLSAAEIPQATGFDQTRFEVVITQLESEGFVTRDDDDRWMVAD
jgi:A/G-specific adenine glycosylase